MLKFNTLLNNLSVVPFQFNIYQHKISQNNLSKSNKRKILNFFQQIHIHPKNKSSPNKSKNKKGKNRLEKINVKYPIPQNRIDNKSKISKKKRMFPKSKTKNEKPF